MPHNDTDTVTILGETNFRNVRRAFGIKVDDRRRHVYVIGKTGVGKTTFLENMVIQDIQNGQGLAVVDPHGDFASGMLDYVPPGRVNDVIYFDPSDAEYPIAFNVLETVGPDDPRFAQEKNLVSSGLIGVFKKLWADSWGPRLEYILRNTILALIDSPGNTLLGIMRVLVDKDFRKQIVDNIRDPVVKSFWVDEFAQYNERFRSEAISPIQNKVGQFLSSSIIRNVLGQPKSTIDLREVMDEGKVFIMDLSKGKIGEDNAALLGAMMITKIQLAAMDRARMAEEERRDFYLYVDEFQNFATESFAAILSEARKYRLNITIAHQYITQMEEPVRDAVFGNVGTMACFRVGAFDAEFLEREYMPHFTQTDLVNLDKYNAYIRLMIDGTASKPFSMSTIPFGSLWSKYDGREKILRVSRERFGRPRTAVEEKISRWSGATFRHAAEEESAAYETTLRTREKPTFVAPRPKAQGRGETTAGRPARMATSSVAGGPARAPARQSLPASEAIARGGPVVVEPSPDTLEDVVTVSAPTARITNLDETLRRAEEPRRLQHAYPTTCDRCGRATEVPFEPKPGKPKYCVECLALVRADRKSPAGVPGLLRATYTEVPRPVSPASPPLRAPAMRSARPTPPALPKVTAPNQPRTLDGTGKPRKPVDDWEDPERQ